MRTQRGKSAGCLGGVCARVSMTAQVHMSDVLMTGFSVSVPSLMCVTLHATMSPTYIHVTCLSSSLPVKVGCGVSKLHMLDYPAQSPVLTKVLHTPHHTSPHYTTCRHSYVHVDGMTN